MILQIFTLSLAFLAFLTIVGLLIRIMDAIKANSLLHMTSENKAQYAIEQAKAKRLAMIQLKETQKVYTDKIDEIDELLKLL